MFSSRVLLMRDMVDFASVVESSLGSLVSSSRALLVRGMVESSLVFEGSQVACVFAVVGERVGFDECVDFERG